MLNFVEVGSAGAKTVANSGVFKNFVESKLGYSYANQFTGDTYVSSNTVQLVAEWELEIDSDDFVSYILSSDVSSVEAALRDNDEGKALEEASFVYSEAWENYLSENSYKLGSFNSEINNKFKDMLDGMLITLRFNQVYADFAFNELYSNFSYEFDTRVLFESNDFPGNRDQWIVDLVEKNMSEETENEDEESEE